MVHAEDDDGNATYLTAGGCACRRSVGPPHGALLLLQVVGGKVVEAHQARSQEVEGAAMAWAWAPRGLGAGVLGHPPRDPPASPQAVQSPRPAGNPEPSATPLGFVSSFMASWTGLM